MVNPRQTDWPKQKSSVREPSLQCLVDSSPTRESRSQPRTYTRPPSFWGSTARQSSRHAGHHAMGETSHVAFCKKTATSVATPMPRPKVVNAIVPKVLRKINRQVPDVQLPEIRAPHPHGIPQALSLVCIAPGLLFLASSMIAVRQSAQPVWRITQSN